LTANVNALHGSELVKKFKGKVLLAFGRAAPEIFPKGQEIKAASIGGLCNSSFATAFLARRRIDFAAGLHLLHYHG